MAGAGAEPDRSPLRIEPLTGEHRLELFKSGVASVDQWLLDSARTAESAGNARVYVLAEEGAEDVVGFYAISAASVERGRATGRNRRNAPNPVPAILIGRLAVRADRQGEGLGALLLRDALLRSLRAAEAIGARCVLVHAADESAVGFYSRFGFESSPTDPLNLQLALQDLRRSSRS